MSAPTLKELCAKATPGPWRTALDEGESHALDSDVTSILGTICECRQGLSWKSAEANAQLIARCSPDVMLKVYEFIETMTRYVRETTYPDGPCLKREDHDEAKQLLNALDGLTK